MKLKKKKTKQDISWQKGKTVVYAILQALDTPGTNAATNIVFDTKTLNSKEIDDKSRKTFVSETLSCTLKTHPFHDS